MRRTRMNFDIEKWHALHRNWIGLEVHWSGVN